MSDNTLHACQYCGKNFSSKSNLLNHQKNAKYCLEIQLSQQQNTKDLKQTKDKISLRNEKIECEYCNGRFSHKSSYTRHKTICKAKTVDNELLQSINERDNEIYVLKQTIKELDRTIREQNQTIHEQEAKIYEKSEELTSRGREMGKYINETIEQKRQIKELQAENKKLAEAEHNYSKKYETCKNKCTVATKKHEKQIALLKDQLSFEKGRVAGYENKAMFRGTTNVNNISSSSVTNKKLAKICIANIEPFTMDIVEKNIDKFTADRYIRGAHGVAGFLEDITKVVDEDGNINRNLVCTDKARGTFYKLDDSEWKVDDGISCINSVLDTLEPVTMQLDREISKSVATQQSEKYKGIPVNDLGKGFTKEPESERHKLVCDVRNHVKDKIAV